MNRARGRTNTLLQQTQEYAGAADSIYNENPSLASDISALTTDIEQAYTEFKTESSFFVLSSSIDMQIRAAALFTKATQGLAYRAASSPSVRSNLLRIASHLAIAEDLMRHGTIKPATLTEASSAAPQSIRRRRSLDRHPLRDSDGAVPA